MPRVHAKTKSKRGIEYNCISCPEKIKAGEKYFEWTFRYGDARRQHASHGHPKQSQLTRSKMSSAYAAIEGAESDISDCVSAEDIAQCLRDCADEIENVRQEYQDGLDNMPDGLRDAAESGETGERMSALEEFGSDLQSAADEIESEAEPTEPNEGEELEETKAGWIEDMRQRASDALSEYTF